MEQVLHLNGFWACPANEVPCCVEVEVYGTPDGQEVVVYLHEDPQGQLAQLPHLIINQLYEEALLMVFPGQRRFHWYFVGEQGPCQVIHLQGIPGCYTWGYIDQGDSLPVQITRPSLLPDREVEPPTPRKSRREGRHTVLSALA